MTKLEMSEEDRKPSGDPVGTDEILCLCLLGDPNAKVRAVEIIDVTGHNCMAGVNKSGQWRLRMCLTVTHQQHQPKPFPYLSTVWPE